MRWILKFYFNLNKIWEGSFILISVEFSPLNVFLWNLCNCRHLFMRVVFVRTVSVMLYCDSLVASHIIDHGKRWFKLRPRCFVNSQLLWRYWRWRICSSIWRIFAYWKFPRLSVDEWSDVEYKTELRFAKKHLPELCECLGIPEKITCVQRTVCGRLEGLCFVKGVGIPL